MSKTKKLKLVNDDEFKKIKGVSQAQYARSRNMTRQNVSKHVQNGVIKLLPNGNIYPSQADKQLEENKDPAFFKGKKAGQGKSKMNFNTVRTLDKGYDVKLKELVYKKKIGEVVNAKDVDTAYFNIGRKVRDNMLNIPDRIVAQILSIFGIDVSSENTNKGRKVIVKEIEKGLQGI